MHPRITQRVRQGRSAWPMRCSPPVSNAYWACCSASHNAALPSAKSLPEPGPVPAPRSARSPNYFESDLVTLRAIGNQKRYQANAEAPIHAELVGIVRKTIGMAEPLREALASLAAGIIAAFVYGSVAKGSDTASSDIDLMILSDTLTYADIVGALHSVILQLGREVNPTLYSRAELARRIKQGNAFVTRVLEQPKLWLIGNERDLSAG